MSPFCCAKSQSKNPSVAVQVQAFSYDGQAQPEAFRSVELPQAHPDHSFPDYGWTIVTAHPELLKSYQALLEASKTFFALPEGEKAVFKTTRGSEDGWNLVEGEKEFITLRTLERTPEQMRDAAVI